MDAITKRLSWGAITKKLGNSKPPVALPAALWWNNTRTGSLFYKINVLGKKQAVARKDFIGGGLALGCSCLAKM